MKKASLFVILSLFLVCLLLGAFLVFRNLDAETLFAQNGFILTDEVYTAEDGTFARGYEFLGGTQYNMRPPERISFTDRDGNKIYADLNGFVHYEDGAISTLSNAVLMNLDDLGSSLVNYYNITPATPIERAGESYMIQQPSGEVMIDSFIMKLEGGKLIIAAPAIDLYTSGDTPQEYGGYLEVNYIDENVTSIVHDSGALLTVAPECYAMVGNTRIDLASKRIVRPDTNDVMYLDQMVVGADDNIDVVDNMSVLGFRIPQIKLPDIEIKTPTFVAINGEDGEDGDSGTNGDSGRAGADGVVGKTGGDGSDGDIGKDGTVGFEGRSGESGEDGVDGQAGVNGQSGSPGAAGQTVGGDSAGDDDSAVDSSTANIPSVKLDPLEFSVSPAGGLETVLNMKNTDLGMLAQYGTIKIVESATGRVVYLDATVPIGESESLPITITAEMIRQWNEDTYGTLTYKLIEGAEYQFTVEGDFDYDGNTYHRVFLSKLFRPSTAGIDLYFQSAGTDWLTFAVQAVKKNDAFTVDELYLQLIDGITLQQVTGHRIRIVLPTVVPVGTDRQFDDTTGLATVTFIGDGGSAPYLEPDHPYLAQIAGLRLAADPSNAIDQYGAPVEGRTLKDLPTIGGVNVILGSTGFSLQAAKVVIPSGVAGDMVSYRYEIYEAAVLDPEDAEPIYTVEASTLNPVSAPLGSGNGSLGKKLERFPAEYRARVVGMFMDNSKAVEIVMDRNTSVSVPPYPTPRFLSDPFSISQGVMPVVTFVEGASVGPTTIDGVIHITPPADGATIKSDVNGATFIISLVNSSGGPAPEGTWPIARTVTIAGGSGDYEIPITQGKLSTNSVYTLTVSAFVDLDGPGGNLYREEQMSIGSVNARTLGHPPLITAMSIPSTNPEGYTMNVEVKILPLAAGQSGWNATTPEGLAEIAAAETEVGQIERLEFRIYRGDLAELIESKQAMPEYRFNSTAERNQYFIDNSGELVDGVVVSCGDTVYKYGYMYDEETKSNTWKWGVFTDNDTLYTEELLQYQYGDPLYLNDSLKFNPDNISQTYNYNFESEFTDTFMKGAAYPLNETSFNKTAAYFDAAEMDKFTVVLAYGYDYAGNRITFYKNYGVFELQPPSPQIVDADDYFTVTPFTNASIPLMNAGISSRSAYIEAIAPTMSKSVDYMNANLQQSTLAGYTVSTPKLQVATKIVSLTYSMYVLNQYDSTGGVPSLTKLSFGDVTDLPGNATHVADFIFNRPGLFSNNGLIPKLSVVLTGSTDMDGADPANVPSDAIETNLLYRTNKYYLDKTAWQSDATPPITELPSKIFNSSVDGTFLAYVKADRGKQYFFTVKATYKLTAGEFDPTYTLPDDSATPTVLMRSRRLDTPKQEVAFKFFPAKVTASGVSGGFQPHINYTFADLDRAGISVSQITGDANSHPVALNISESGTFTAAEVIGPSTAAPANSETNWFMTENGASLLLYSNQKLYNYATAPDKKDPLTQRAFEAFKSIESNTNDGGDGIYYPTKFPVAASYEVSAGSGTNRFEITLKGIEETQKRRVAGIEVTVAHSEFSMNGEEYYYAGAGIAKYVLTATPAIGKDLVYYLSYDLLPPDGDNSTNYVFTVKALYDEGNGGFDSAATGVPGRYYAFQMFGADLPSKIETTGETANPNDTSSTYRVPQTTANVLASTQHAFSHGYNSAGSIYEVTVARDTVGAGAPTSIAWENMLAEYQKHGATARARRSGTFMNISVTQEGLLTSDGYMNLKKLSEMTVGSDTTINGRGAPMPEIRQTSAAQPGVTLASLSFAIKNRSGLKIDGDKTKLYIKLWGGNTGGNQNNEDLDTKTVSLDTTYKYYDYNGGGTAKYTVAADGYLLFDASNPVTLDDEIEFSITFTGLQPGKDYWVSFFTDSDGGVALPLYDPVRLKAVTMADPNKYQFKTRAKINISGEGDEILYDRMEYIAYTYGHKAIQLKFTTDAAIGYYLVYTLEVLDLDGTTVLYTYKNQELTDKDVLPPGAALPGMNKTVDFTYRPGNIFGLAGGSLWQTGVTYRVTVQASPTITDDPGGAEIGKRQYEFTMRELASENFASTVTPTYSDALGYMLTYRIAASDVDRVLVDSTFSPGNGSYKVRLFKVGDTDPLETDWDDTVFTEAVPVELLVFNSATVTGGLSATTAYELRIYAISNTENALFTDPPSIESPMIDFRDDYVIFSKTATTTNSTGISVGTISANTAADNTIALTFDNGANLTNITRLTYTITDLGGNPAIPINGAPYTNTLNVSGQFTAVNADMTSYRYNLPVAYSGAGTYLVTLKFYEGSADIGGNYSVSYVII
jgi:hypothetical protein